MMNATPWIVRRPDPSKKFRLFCFSYAGGSAVSFMEWQSMLHPNVKVCGVQLPGRGARYHETPYSSLPELIETLAGAIGKMDDLPCAFFGHSLGGLLAFELARYHRRRGLMLPQHLFVSGCHAPRYRAASSDLHRLDDESLIARLRDYRGTPPEILAHRELMELVLPTIRADFSLVENYRYEADASLLDIPLTVLAGRSDSFASVEQVEGWQEETLAPCRVQWFDGDHFFIHSCQQGVIDCIHADLAPWLEVVDRKCA